MLMFSAFHGNSRIFCLRGYKAMAIWSDELRATRLAQVTASTFFFRLLGLFEDLNMLWPWQASTKAKVSPTSLVKKVELSEAPQSLKSFEKPKGLIILILLVLGLQPKPKERPQHQRPPKKRWFRLWVAPELPPSASIPPPAAQEAASRCPSSALDHHKRPTKNNHNHHHHNNNSHNHSKTPQETQWSLEDWLETDPSFIHILPLHHEHSESKPFAKPLQPSKPRPQTALKQRLKAAEEFAQAAPSPARLHCLKHSGVSALGRLWASQWDLSSFKNAFATLWATVRGLITNCPPL